jgi:5-methylcytosine-specific restriction endonuclease McrA
MLKGQINPAIRDGSGNIIPWRVRNRDAANAATRNLRANQPEKIRKQNRKWRENNPFAVAVIVARKRARDLGVDSTLTRQEWEFVVRSHEFICHICGDKVSLELCRPETLSLDHLVPMSRGGANAKTNVAPAHRRCNQNRTNMTLGEFDSWLEKVSQFRGKGNGRKS